MTSGSGREEVRWDLSLDVFHHVYLGSGRYVRPRLGTETDKTYWRSFTVGERLGVTVETLSPHFHGESRPNLL